MDISHKGLCETIVIIQISSDDPIRSRFLLNNLPEHSRKEPVVFRFYINYIYLRTNCLIRLNLLPVLFQGFAVYQQYPHEIF